MLKQLSTKHDLLEEKVDRLSVSQICGRAGLTGSQQVLVRTGKSQFQVNVSSG